MDLETAWSFEAGWDPGIGRSASSGGDGVAHGLESGGAASSGGEPVARDGRYDAVSVSEAREELLNYLVHLKESGTRVSAKVVCELCWWIDKSFEEQLPACSLKAIARRPGLQSGKYSLHFDQVIYGGRPTDKDWYRVEAPVFLKCSGERVIRPIASLPPHEAVSDCIRRHGHEIKPKFMKARDSLSLPQSYYKHPCVIEAPGELVYMYGI